MIRFVSSFNKPTQDIRLQLKTKLDSDCEWDDKKYWLKR